jgi:hypothetical protein
MALWSTQSLTEMSTRNIPGGKGPTTLPPSVSRLSRKCGSLDVSKPCGPSALPFAKENNTRLCTMEPVAVPHYAVIISAMNEHQGQ